MHIRQSVRRLSRLLIFALVSLNALQPLTIHATPSGVILTGDEPPSTILLASSPKSFVFAAESALPAVTIIDAGKAIVAKSASQSVATILKEQAILVGSEDIVQPSLGARIDTLHTIRIIRVTHSLIDVAQEIAPQTIYQSDPTTSTGVENVQQGGIAGSTITHFEVTNHDGLEVRKTVLSTQTSIGKPRIISRGTKVSLQNVSVGGASWYDGGPGKLTAAHRTLPFGTKVLVTNQANNLSVVVTIEDRGPFIGGRIIDLSPDSFAKIAGLGSGVVQVTMTRL